jgi:hypothetical protein
MAALVAALTVVGCLAACQKPTTASAPLDCTTWRYGPADEPASLPPELDRTNYKRT